MERTGVARHSNELGSQLDGCAVVIGVRQHHHLLPTQHAPSALHHLRLVHRGVVPSAHATVGHVRCRAQRKVAANLHDDAAAAD
eukprot:3052459-Rhodomonas_salina.2